MTDSPAPDGDHSNGYQAAAPLYIKSRRESGVGAETVRAWARSLPRPATVLDLGCGHGVPISQVLLEEGLSIWAVDASTAMIAAYRERFPQVPVACEPVETSGLFGLKFDAAVAWGLMFLLEADAQRGLIRKVASVLKPGGRFLFTAPEQVCTWNDLLTGLPSRSLGSAVYARVLAEAGLELVGRRVDGGNNYYYDAQRS